MRAFYLQGLAARFAASQTSGSQSMDFWVEHGGVSAAAWLVWKHRKQLKRTGVVEFFIDTRVQTPAWFRVALETLKQRACWSVSSSQVVRTGQRTYTIRWQRWHTFAYGKQLKRKP